MAMGKLEARRECSNRAFSVLTLALFFSFCWNFTVHGMSINIPGLPPLSLPIPDSINIPGLPPLSLPIPDSINIAGFPTLPVPDRINIPGLPPLSLPNIPGLPDLADISNNIPAVIRDPSIVCSIGDSVALLSFKAQLEDPKEVLSSWNPVSDCCLWRGVACSPNPTPGGRRVTGLQLTRALESEKDTGLLSISSMLKSIAGVPLGALSSMETLSFMDVNFDSDLPAAWGLLSNLTTLSLINCSFTGGLPPAFARLLNLRHLHLSENRLRGQLPLYMTEVFRRLSTLDLSSNSFTGGIVLLFRSNLTSLDLANNELDDDPLPDLFGFLPNLRHLDLSHNRFRGTVPQSLQLLRQLRYLDLSNNNLEGSLPVALFSIQTLKTVFLHDNRLSGTIPGIFPNRSEMEDLDLANNMLSGLIPPSIGMLGRLKMLDLSNNNLSMVIPDTIIFNLQLEFLFLEHNGLTGLIPQEFAWLNNLILANVSHNYLFGPIPGGPWPSFPASSYDANLFLCNPPLDRCPFMVNKPVRDQLHRP